MMDYEQQHEQTRRRQRKGKHKVRNTAIMVVILLIVCMITFFMFLKIVPDGNVGVVTRLGAARDNYITPGPFLKLPIDTVYNMSTQVETYSFDFIAFSSDMQQVSGRATVFHVLDKEHAVDMFRGVGRNYEQKLIVPKAQESIKNVIGQYNAETLVDLRSQVSDSVKDDLNNGVSAYGVHIDDIAIENMDFSDIFEQAIEAKQVATQEKLKEQTNQEQQTIIAKGEAERANIKAKAEAERKLIEAQAEADAKKVAADAEAYRLQQESAYITSETIQKQLIQKWDGVLPITFGGDGVKPILDVSDIMKATE